MSLKDPYTSLQAFIEHGHTDRIGDLVICQLVTVLISDDTELFEPTACALSAAQARNLGYHVTLAAPAADLLSIPEVDRRIDSLTLDELHAARRFVVVSTQGRGDEAALRSALATEAAYHAFVGSRRKMASLRDKLLAEGTEAARLDRVKAPAGLDLGAITPEEIAMSILAEITLERRRGQRAPSTDANS